MLNIYDDFYEQFIPEINSRINEFPNWLKTIPNRQKKKPYIGFGTGISRVGYYSEYTSKGYGGLYKGYIVGIYIDGELYKQRLEYLEQYKLTIEDSLGSSLSWLDTGKAGRIFFRLEGLVEDKLKWTEVIKWQIDNLIKIMNIFKPFIDEMKNYQFDNKEKIFYGLWCSRSENINNVLESGKWINRLSNEVRRVEQLRSIEIGSKVFLYQGVADIKYKETPFSEYVSEKIKEKTASFVKSYCTGIVKSINIEDYSISVDWKVNYEEKSWFIYYRQDGVWTFDLTTRDRHQKIFCKALYEIVFGDKEQDAKWWVKQGFMSHYLKEENMKTESKNVSLNQILYGPPGTGKTYNTINKALEIIDGKVPDARSEAKERFEELQNNGQIEFVTFHQSYGYEEFVEGIKANAVGGNISYDIECGVFKRFCKKAKANNLFSLGQIIGKYEIVGFSNELLKLKRQSGSIIPIPMYILNEVFD